MSPISTIREYLFGSSPSTDDPPSPQAAPPNEPPKPFRLDNDSAATLTLQDGRKLGYAQYGALTGRPIFFLHGLPGSRFDAAGFDDIGKEVNARLIAVDRPGIGWSSPQPNRKLLDYPKDIEQLADHLNLDRYSVLGISGGGPPALSCAKALPANRLKCVSLVVAMGPPDIGMSGAGWLHKLGFPYGYRYAPLSAVRWFWQWEGAGRLDIPDSQRLSNMLAQPLNHPKDAAFMESAWPPLSVRSTREAFAQGYGAVWQDGKLMCTDFGFTVEDIRRDLQVQLWYGKWDTFVPPNHGVQIAKRLGEGERVQLNVVDETHASIVVNRPREILEVLVRCT